MAQHDIDRRRVPEGRRQQHSGVVRRGALRPPRPAPPARDVVGPVLVAVVIVVAIVAFSGMFDGGGATPAPVAALTPSASPTSTGAPAPTGSSANSPRATASRAPSPSPSPSPTASPSPSRTPSPSPTASPSPSPTGSPSPTPSLSSSPSAPASGLVILEPADGARVAERGLLIRGLAPAGATVTHDIAFWFDEHTQADSAGRWSFAVQLRPGENELTFRIGSDKSTAQTITVELVVQ